MSYYDDASLIMYPSGYKADKIYSLKPTDGSGDFDFARASSATRVNADGLIESVATGVPRIDYTGGGCGKLLLEPQRTNFITQSSNLSLLSKVAVGTASPPVTTANYATSPDGTQNATRVVFDLNGGSDRSILRQAIPLGSDYYFSIYVKSTNGTDQKVMFHDGDEQNTYTVTNEWQRITYDGRSGISYAGIALTGNSGVDTSDILVWGFQVEQGSYPTSYIPTAGATVTRLADSASKTGISSLIGQTEGTLFLELDIIAGTPVYHTLIQVYGDDNNRIAIGQDIDSTNVFMYINGSGTASYQVATTPAGHYKIALAYKNGDSVLYINGAAAITNARAISLSTSLSTLFLNNVNGNEIGIFKNYQSILFKTRLTNTELAALTTL